MPGADSAGFEHELRDLDPVQGGALAEVVARELERETVFRGLVAADPADERLVAAAHRVCAEVQRRVADYLGLMAGARPVAVDVVVDEVETQPR